MKMKGKKAITIAVLLIFIILVGGVILLKNNVLKISISKKESYVGKYADVDGDGIVDGVIYADLAVGGSGAWGDETWSSYGTFKIPEKYHLKEYYVSQKSYTNEINGEQEVITAKDTDGKPRFYVMALNDIDEKSYNWYFAANGKMNDYAKTTSIEFGKGESNTKNMIEKWNEEAYGEQNACLPTKDFLGRPVSSYKDLWGQIQEQVNNGWYVPSREEWAAFGYNLNKDLGGTHWSSSQYCTDEAWRAENYHISGDSVCSKGSVRLGTTF